MPTLPIAPSADFLAWLAPDRILLWLLAMVRFLGMLLASPLFGQTQLPMQVRVMVAMALTLVLAAGLSAGAPPALPGDLPRFLLLVGQELGLGLLIGYSFNLVFYAIKATGEYLSMQIGLNAASALDPSMGMVNAIMGQLYFYVAMLALLGLNLHHWLIASVYRSFAHLPVGQSWSRFSIVSLPLKIAVGLFSVSLCLPFTVELLTQAFERIIRTIPAFFG